MKWLNPSCLSRSNCVLMASAYRFAKNCKICSNEKSHAKYYRRYRSSKNKVNDVIHRGNAYHAFFHLGFICVLRGAISVNKCVLLIDETKMEGIMVYAQPWWMTSHAMFFITCFSIIDISVNIGRETCRLNGFYYFLLIYNLKPSKHDSVSSATDPFCIDREWPYSIIYSHSFTSSSGFTWSCINFFLSISPGIRILGLR